MTIEERIEASRAKIAKNRIRKMRMDLRREQRLVQLCPLPPEGEIRAKYLNWHDSVHSRLEKVA